MMTQEHSGPLHYSASAVQYSNGSSRVNGILAANFHARKSDGGLQAPYENGSHSPSLSPKSSPLHSSNDALNSSASVSSGVGSHNSSILTPSPASNASLADYLSQLIKDRKKIQEMPWNNFEHVNRLLDEEIDKVRKNLFDWNPETKEPLLLPEANGEVMEMQEKVFIPSEEHPDFNFVGRILGPRGLTAKQLEKTTQCKIMIRGQGSMRDKAKEELNRGKPTWEHLSEKLHVLITAKDTPDRARIKLNHAVSEIKKLLVPVKESDDELKKRQLMELAILNGTYRDSSPKPQQFLVTPAVSQYYLADNVARLGLLNLSRQTALGTPLVLPSIPAGRPMSAMSSTASSTPSYYATPSPTYVNDAVTLANGGLFINPYDYAAYNPALATSFLNGDYATVDQSAAGGFYRSG